MLGRPGRPQYSEGLSDKRPKYSEGLACTGWKKRRGARRAEGAAPASGDARVSPNSRQAATARSVTQRSGAQRAHFTSSWPRMAPPLSALVCTCGSRRGWGCVAGERVERRAGQRREQGAFCRCPTPASPLPCAPSSHVGVQLAGLRLGLEVGRGVVEGVGLVEDARRVQDGAHPARQRMEGGRGRGGVGQAGGRTSWRLCERPMHGTAHVCAQAGGDGACRGERVRSLALEGNRAVVGEGGVDRQLQQAEGEGQQRELHHGCGAGLWCTRVARGRRRAGLPWPAVHSTRARSRTDRPTMPPITGPLTPTTPAWTCEVVMLKSLHAHEWGWVEAGGGRGWQRPQAISPPPSSPPAEPWRCMRGRAAQRRAGRAHFSASSSQVTMSLESISIRNLPEAKMSVAFSQGCGRAERGGTD